MSKKGTYCIQCHDYHDGACPDGAEPDHQRPLQMQIVMVFGPIDDSPEKWHGTSNHLDEIAYLIRERLAQVIAPGERVQILLIGKKDRGRH